MLSIAIHDLEEVMECLLTDPAGDARLGGASHMFESRVGQGSQKDLQSWNKIEQNLCEF